MEECKACGKCCKKHWLVRLHGRSEIEMFKNHIVFGNYIWTDLCPHLKGGKCEVHEDKPQRCKEYFCEGRKL